MSLSWYYVYSQRYEALHHMLKDTVKDPPLNLVPLFVDQSEFNKTTYNENKNHFLSGCFIKEEVILHILKKLPINSYFIFTDVDVAVLNNDGLFDFFQTYIEKEYDIVYTWEGNNSDSKIKNYNIGISLIRVNEKTIQFFEAFMEKSRGDTNIADQELVCSLLPDFQGKFCVFDKNVVCLSNYFNETEPKSGIKLIQILCSNSKDYRRNMYEKYCGAKAFGLPIEKYITLALENGRTRDEIGIE
jgi:hypothetical protein